MMEYDVTIEVPVRIVLKVEAPSRDDAETGVITAVRRDAEGYARVVSDNKIMLHIPNPITVREGVVVRVNDLRFDFVRNGGTLLT